MAELEEPNSKRAKMATDDFGGFDWMNELPDELLDSTPSTSSAGANGGGGQFMANGIGQLFAGNQPPPAFAPQHQHHHQQQQQQSHPHHHSIPNGQSSLSGNSVLEELLLTNRGPGQQQQLQQAPQSMAPQQQQQQLQQRPPGMPPQSYMARGPAPPNRLASPPNVQVVSRQMAGVYPTDGGGGGYHPGPPMVSAANGMPPAYRGGAPPHLHPDHMAMMGGPQQRPQRAPANYVRFQRAPMMANGPGPGQQQMIPVNVVHQQGQPPPQMHPQMRMVNGSGPINPHMGINHQSFQAQDVHPSQLPPPPQFQMGPQQMMRPRQPMHAEMNGPPMNGPRAAMGDPFSPPMQPARMQYQPPPTPNMMDMMGNGLPPSAGSLPYPSPGALMSPPANSGGPPSIDPASVHSSAPPQDPEKRKLIQQQLVLLLHALKCQERERTSEQSACSLPHCGTMKTVITHMANCPDGRGCTVPHCASSRQILTHWRTCQRPDCPVCSPLRQMTDRNGRTNGASQQQAAANGHASSSERHNANENQVVIKPDPDAPPPGSRASQLFSQDSTESSSGFTPKLPAPENASVQREWHRQVTVDLRNHLVSKLVKAIFPSPDPAAMHDQRIRDLIQYARKVEKEMFETASDREEYYHLLAEKIYKIQKELQDKKQRRLEQQQGRPSGASSLFAPSDPFQSNPFEASSSASTTNGGAPPPPANTASQAQVKTEELESATASKPDPPSSQPSTEVKIKSEPVEEKSNEPAVKKVFTVEELSAGLLPILERFEATEEGIPFRVPVDPILLGIPDYFDVIKNPMDLSTIRSKLLDGGYTEPWQFCDDMWLMFDNAWAYNRKASKVHKYCTKLSEMFVEAIDPVMRSLGYCCGRKLAFTPLALVCYGQSMCSIPREAMYYCYEENKSQFGVAPERYTYCKKCFEELPGDSINMSEDPNSSDNLILKSSFKLLKNDQIEYEPLVECVDCGRKWHKVCALHLEQIYPAGFICDTCVRTRGRRKGENRFTAKRLPQCKLSLHLEKRVGEFLRKKLTPETPAGEVTIRVLSSSDKEVEVKPHMRSKFCPPNGEMKEKYPYRAKAIFAFEVIDGVEVCFFGLHVQEYGSSCSPPNQRRVYIAYLDSVHFFTPKIVRTQVYHEILLGYLEYVKRLGYTMAHIWACPPSEGDDYIFHCHPPEQKIPKPKRLQEWYKKMLDKAIVERVVTDYKDIYDFYQKEEPLTSVTELPMFEGDYWPNIIEECIREVDAEEAERRREAEAATFADDVEEDPEELLMPGKKRSAQNNKKHKSKSKSTSSKKSKKNMSGTGDDLTDKVMAALEKHKEVFFVVRLYSKQTAASMHPTQDPDPHITCEFMDGRDTFLSTARDRHWEFSSLRRAKYSTMALCYELHTQGSDKFVYTCNTCKNTNAAWHCGECEDFDLCQECYGKTKHEHKMDKIIVSEDATAGQDGAAAANPRDRNDQIQKCIQTLVHASQCRDANCRRTGCQKMKRVMQHVKMCKNWQNGGGGGPAGNSCSVCRQLLSLCLHHARQCQENTCIVPLCLLIRQKLAAHQAQLRKKRDREMMRRINLMSNQQSVVPPPQAAAATGPFQQAPSPAPGLASSSSSYPPHPNSMAVVPGANPAALRAARDIEKIAQQQVHQLGPGPGQFAPRPPPPSPWDKPRAYQQQQQQQQHQQFVGGQPPPPQMPTQGLSAEAPRPIDRQQIHNVLQRLKNASSAEERDAIFKAVQNEPVVGPQMIATIIRMTRQAQRPPQPVPPQGQPSWPPAAAAGPSLFPPGPRPPHHRPPYM